MRMDIAFRLVDLQNRANGTELCARDLVAYNNLASAKAQVVEIRFRRIGLGQAVILAIGGSSFANTGKKRTASQAGLIILIADNTDSRLLSGDATTVSPLVCKSHRINRGDSGRLRSRRGG